MHLFSCVIGSNFVLHPFGVKVWFAHYWILMVIILNPLLIRMTYIMYVCIKKD